MLDENIRMPETVEELTAYFRDLASHTKCGEHKILDCAKCVERFVFDYAEYMTDATNA